MKEVANEYKKEGRHEGKNEISLSKGTCFRKKRKKKL